MPTLPWIQITQPAEQQTYTAMLTFLPLKHFRDTPRFLLYVFQITNQLRKTEGLIGFSLRAQPLKKKYWTLSVWQDGQHINNYVMTPPHSDIRHKMKGAMGETAFTSWQVTTEELPVQWDEAVDRQLKSYN